MKGLDQGHTVGDQPPRVSLGHPRCWPPLCRSPEVLLSGLNPPALPFAYLPRPHARGLATSVWTSLRPCGALTGRAPLLHCLTTLELSPTSPRPAWVPSVLWKQFWSPLSMAGPTVTALTHPMAKQSTGYRRRESSDSLSSFADHQFWRSRSTLDFSVASSV